jgi:hypothetical protein
MRQILFISAKKIKGCGKDVERQVPFCFKEGFIIPDRKTFYNLLLNVLLKKQVMRQDPYLIRAYSF